MGFPGDNTGGKNPPANAGDIRDRGSIRRSGRSPGRGHGNPPQDSCLENLKDGGAWWATVHGATKSQTQLKHLGTSCMHRFMPNRIAKFGLVRGVCVYGTNFLYIYRRRLLLLVKQIWSVSSPFNIILLLLTRSKHTGKAVCIHSDPKRCCPPVQHTKTAHCKQRAFRSRKGQAEAGRNLVWGGGLNHWLCDINSWASPGPACPGMFTQTL